MAKAPPPEDLFDVTIHKVKPEALGLLMAQLAKMGFSEIEYHLITHVNSFATRKTHDIKAVDFLASWVADHPTFKAREAVTHFDLHGRTAGACYSALRNLVDDKVLKSLGEGNYAHRDVKQLAAPKKAKPAKAAAPKHKTPNSEFLLNFASKNGGRLVRAAAIKAMNKAGRNPSGISSTINELLANSKIERVEEGIYSVLKPKTNGGTVEAAHG